MPRPARIETLQIRLHSVLQHLVCRYILWKYGCCYHLKPPLGYSKYAPRPIWYRVCYDYIQYPIWQMDNWLFKRYGLPVRVQWLKQTRLPRVIE